MLTDDDIENEYWDKKYPIPDQNLFKFARAIEAKVRAEYEPKFKVGDTVRTIYNRDKDAIIAKVEVYGLSYEGDDCGSIYGYQEYEIEKIQEDEKC